MLLPDLLQDREVRDSYSFGVIADNYLSSVIQTGTAQVTINILDINDEAPVFGQRLYTATVLERTPTNSVVLVVTASDDDTQNVSQVLDGLQLKSLLLLFSAVVLTTNSVLSPV